MSLLRWLLPVFIGTFPLTALSDASVEMEGVSHIRIHNGTLTKPVIERVQELFRQYPSIAVIELENILGGLTLAESRLYGPFYTRKVVVKGYCMSACATLAMSSKQVQMHRDALLMFHGMFDVQTGEWRTESLGHLNWLASKFPTVDPEAIRVALSSKDRTRVGLVINAPENGNLLSVRLCNPVPDNCRTVRYMSPGESAISILR